MFTPAITFLCTEANRRQQNPEINIINVLVKCNYRCILSHKYSKGIACVLLYHLLQQILPSHFIQHSCFRHRYKCYTTPCNTLQPINSGLLN